MILKYEFSPGYPTDKIVELEYFCRGAAAMNSNGFDWSSGDNTVTIFLVGEDIERMRQKLEGFFGRPATIILDDGKTMCMQCSGKGKRTVIDFDNGYQPKGTKIETCPHCIGLGYRA